jgi:hypothetical protein
LARSRLSGASDRTGWPAARDLAFAGRSDAPDLLAAVDLAFAGLPSPPDCARGTAAGDLAVAWSPDAADLLPTGDLAEPWRADAPDRAGWVTPERRRTCAPDLGWGHVGVVAGLWLGDRTRHRSAAGIARADAAPAGTGAIAKPLVEPARVSAHEQRRLLRRLRQRDE